MFWKIHPSVIYVAFCLKEPKLNIKTLGREEMLVVPIIISRPCHEVAIVWLQAQQDSFYWTSENYLTGYESKSHWVCAPWTNTCTLDMQQTKKTKHWITLGGEQTIWLVITNSPYGCHHGSTRQAVCQPLLPPPSPPAEAADTLEGSVALRSEHRKPAAGAPSLEEGALVFFCFPAGPGHCQPVVKKKAQRICRFVIYTVIMTREGQ